MAGGISPLLPLITSSMSSQGWGSGGSAFVPELPKPISAEETALQRLEAEWLRRNSQKKGLLGSILSGSWKGVSKALNFIARPSYALAEGTRRALHGEDNDFDVSDFFHGIVSGLKGDTRTGFGEVLGEHNIGGKRLQGLLGFGLDVATDPLMLASIAATPVTGGASLALVGERLAARGLTLKGVQEATRVAEHGTDDLAAAMAARDTLYAAGDGFAARANLADKQVDLLVSKQGGARVTPADLSELHGRQALARAEARNELPNVLAFTYKIPFSKSTKGRYYQNGRFVARTPIKTIGMKTIADLKIPVVSKTAENIGKAFKPGWRNDRFHALERVGRATVEVREKEYIAAIGHILKPYINPKSEKFLAQPEQLDALDWGETAKGLVRNIKDSDGHIISRVLDREMIGKAVAEGTLSPKQGEFIDAWQKATEVLADADYEYGRFYGAVTKSAEKDGNDVLYVPHVYTKDGRKLTEQLGTSIMTKPGFQYERLSKQPTSAKALKDLYESGEYSRLVETDPSTLLAMRARRGAQSHADAMIEKVIATTYGIPTKVADVAKQAEHADAIAQRQARINKLSLSTPEGATKAAEDLIQKAEAKIAPKRAEALAKFDARTEQLRKEIKRIQAAIRRPSMPSGNAIVHMSGKDFNEVFGKSSKYRPIYGFGQRVRGSFSAAQHARRVSRSLTPSETRIEKGAFFHVAPKEARDEIRGVGIKSNIESGTAKGRLRVYRKLEDAQEAAAKIDGDVWIINPARATKFKTKNPPKMHTIAHGMDRSDVRLFRGTTAGKPHGSKYRAVLIKALRDAKQTVPRTTKNSSRPMSLAGKYARAFNRDLKNLHDQLLDAQFTRKAGDNWEERLSQAITWIERRSRQDWDNYLKDLGYKAPARNRKAVLAAKKKALASHLSKRDALSARFDARRDAAVARQLPKLRDKAMRQLKARQVQEKKIAKHEKAIQHHETSLNNPGANVPGYVKNDKIRAENGSAMKIPAEMDEAIRRIRHVVHDDQFLADFQRTWSRLMGKWKVAVTVINPGYRLRNTVSDMWNMYVSGVPLWAIGRYGARAGDLIYKKIPSGDPEALKLFQEAYEHSIMSGLFGGDIEQVLRTMRSGLKDVSSRDYAKNAKFVKAYTTFATKFNRDAENWGRLTHYLYRREYEGLSAAEAAARVRTAHFDYEDLTPTERKIKGNLVPFYTWTRNNIPFQLQAMFSSPGRYATFPKLANEMEYAAGEDGGVAPPWINNALGFRVPFGGKNNYFLPQFGPSDLAKLQEPSQIVSLLGPFVKTPVELITNKSMLTGAPIYGSELTHPRNPVSGAAASLLSLLPGANVGQTARVVGGETLRGPGASPLLTYFAGQTPLTNVFVNQMSNIRKAQRGRSASLLSYFGGISTYAPDEKQTLGIAAQDASEAFRQYLRGLRDEGRWPDTESELSDFEKKKQKLLASILQNQ